MHTHDDAIAALLKHGIAASRREWALGDTVVVPLGHPSTTHGITVYPTVAWLVPSHEHSWKLVREVGGTSRTREHPDLDSACLAVFEIAAAFAFFGRAPPAESPLA